MIYVFLSWSFLELQLTLQVTELDDQAMFGRGMASIKSFVYFLNIFISLKVL